MHSYIFILPNRKIIQVNKARGKNAEQKIQFTSRLLMQTCVPTYGFKYFKTFGLIFTPYNV